MAVKPEVILGDITTLDVDVIVMRQIPRCWVVAE